MRRQRRRQPSGILLTDNRMLLDTVRMLARRTHSCMATVTNLKRVASELAVIALQQLPFVHLVRDAED